MRALLLILLFTSSAFSQGSYLSRENAFIAGVFYGRYDTDSKLGFAATYSILGFFDVSFTRSSILTDEDISNFQNEYFIRGYLFKGGQIFGSLGLGFLYQETTGQLWRGFRVKSNTDGIAYEAGLHFASVEKTRGLVFSLFFRYSEPTTELHLQNVVIGEIHLARSYILDIAFIQTIGQFGMVAGPRVALDHDAKNVFWGLNLAAMIRH